MKRLILVLFLILTVSLFGEDQNLTVPGFLPSNLRYVELGMGYDARTKKFVEDKSIFVLNKLVALDMYKPGINGMSRQWMTMSYAGATGFKKNVFASDSGAGMKGFGVSVSVSASSKIASTQSDTNLDSSMDAYWVQTAKWEQIIPYFGPPDKEEYFSLSNFYSVLTEGFYMDYIILMDCWEELNSAIESKNGVAIAQQAARVTAEQQNIYDHYGTHIVTELGWGSVTWVHLAVEGSTTAHTGHNSWGLKVVGTGYGFSASTALSGIKENNSSSEKAFWNGYLIAKPSQNSDQASATSLLAAFKNISVNKMTTSMMNIGPSGETPSSPTPPEPGEIVERTGKPWVKQSAEAVQKAQEESRVRTMKKAKAVGFTGTNWEAYRKWSADSLADENIEKPEVPEPEKLDAIYGENKTLKACLDEHKRSLLPENNAKTLDDKLNSVSNMGDTKRPMGYEVKPLSDYIPGFNNPYTSIEPSSIAMYKLVKQTIVSCGMFNYIVWAYNATRGTAFDFIDENLYIDALEARQLIVEYLETYLKKFEGLNADGIPQSIYNQSILSFSKALCDYPRLKKFYLEFWSLWMQDPATGHRTFPNFGYVFRIDLHNNGEYEVFGAEKDGYKDPFVFTQKTNGAGLSCDPEVMAQRFYPLPVLRDGEWSVCLTTSYGGMLHGFSTFQDSSLLTPRPDSCLVGTRHFMPSGTLGSYLRSFKYVLRHLRKLNIVSDYGHRNYYVISYSRLMNYFENCTVFDIKKDHEVDMSGVSFIPVDDGIINSYPDIETKSFIGGHMVPPLDMETIVSMLFTPDQIKNSRAMRVRSGLE